MRAALALLGGWAGLLVTALLVEHTAFGTFVFHNRVTMVVFLTTAGAVHVASFVCCIVTLAKGSMRERAIVLLPFLLLVLVGLIAIAGPG